MKHTFTSSLLLLAASLLAPAALRAQQLYTNGNFTTGTVAKSGAVAPTGYTWSEVQNDAGVTTIANTSAGFTASKTSGFTLADDFTVPAGQSWTLNNVSFFGYVSGYTGTTSPFTELYVRIWRGSPAVAGSTIVFGDLVTNRYAAATSALSYRIFNSLYPTPTTPGTTRLIWKVRATLAPAPVLTAGTYWVEWYSTVSGTLGHFYIPVTISNLRQTPGANALQYSPTTTSWVAALDTGNPDSAPDVTVDFPFIINDGTITATASASSAGPALRVGPVPASDNVQVELGGARGASELALSDMQGRLVWQGKAAANSTSTTVPLSALAAGIYTLSVSSAEGISRARIAKQ